jgi:hypothetical protein
MKIIKQRRDVPDWAASISQSSVETAPSPEPKGVASLEEVKRPGRFRAWLEARREKKALKKRRKIAGKDWPKYKPHYIHAHIRWLNGTYEWVSWDARDPVPDSLTRQFIYQEHCLMKYRGPNPMVRNLDPFGRLAYMMKNRTRQAILLYTEGDLYPWTAQKLSASDDRKTWSPELVKRYAESNVDNDMLNSMQDKKEINKRTLIIIMVAVAGLIIVTRMLGMW